MPNPGPDESSQSAAPKVSIVVPVYNPGPYLERCISSVLAQTMPPGELEAIFVDDGSTDGSGARLDALAADHPHIRVIHEENSGWGGKPRNVGIEAARGEFVLFLDHDDRLGPEAAERLHARAIQDGSDVILGRTIGHGRLVGSSRGWYTRGPVTFEESPGLIAHLRPHKLVRRQFLLDTGIRFPEGRRRLEDHAFVLEAYFRAHAISVVGDYACYHQIARADRGNAGAQHWEPAYYYGYVREDIQIIERFTEPGPFRNRLLARLVRWEMLSRLSGTRLFLSASPERRRAMVDAVRPILEEHVPLEVDAGLAPGVRVLAALTRADRLDLLETFGGAAAAVRCRARVRSLVRGAGGDLDLTVDVTIVPGEGGVSVAPDGAGGWRLVVPGAVAAVVGPDTLSTSSFDSLIDLVAIDAAATITSIPFSATFVTAPPAHGQAGGHGARPARPVIRVSATGLGASLPADASVGAHGLRFELWLTVMPQRRAARVMFPERIALRARPPASRPALRPRVGLGGRLQLGGRPERLPARAWRVARRLTRRLSRRAAAVVRRLGRRVRRIAGG